MRGISSYLPWSLVIFQMCTRALPITLTAFQCHSNTFSTVKIQARLLLTKSLPQLHVSFFLMYHQFRGSLASGQGWQGALLPDVRQEPRFLLSWNIVFFNPRGYNIPEHSKTSVRLRRSQKPSGINLSPHTVESTQGWSWRCSTRTRTPLLSASRSAH